MPFRKLTDVQIEDGTVLDCGRLDQAVTDTFDALNNIGPDVDLSSMVQKQIVWGETPPRYDWNSAPVVKRLSPWLRAKISDDIGAERLKSNDPYGIATVGGTGTFVVPDGVVWQVSFWTDRPIVVTDLDIAMHLDDPSGEQPNRPYQVDTFGMVWLMTPPTPLVIGNPVEDMVVSLVVDDAYNPQVASQVNLSIHKNFFGLCAQRMTEDEAWSTPDMIPSVLGSAYARGFWIQAKESNVPVPAKSRVRVNIFVPNWATGQEDLINGWINGPGNTLVGNAQNRFKWSATLTYLERKV